MFSGSLTPLHLHHRLLGTAAGQRSGCCSCCWSLLHRLLLRHLLLCFRPSGVHSNTSLRTGSGPGGRSCTPSWTQHAPGSKPTQNRTSALVSLRSLARRTERDAGIDRRLKSTSSRRYLAYWWKQWPQVAPELNDSFSTTFGHIRHVGKEFVSIIRLSRVKWITYQNKKHTQTEMWGFNTKTAASKSKNIVHVKSRDTNTTLLFLPVAMFNYTQHCLLIRYELK